MENRPVPFSMYTWFTSQLSMPRTSTLPDCSFPPVSFQTSSEPNWHRFHFCTGTPPEPPNVALASGVQAPLLAKSCWIITSWVACVPELGPSQMSYAAHALVPLFAFMFSLKDEYMDLKSDSGV